MPVMDPGLWMGCLSGMPGMDPPLVIEIAINLTTIMKPFWSVSFRYISKLIYIKIDF